MRQHIEDAYMKPCGPYRACDNCPASPASLKVFVAQGTCNSDTPDPPVWLVVSGIRDNRDVPEQPQYQLDSRSARLRSGAATSNLTSGA
jgi:hypothetical protein